MASISSHVYVRVQKQLSEQFMVKINVLMVGRQEEHLAHKKLSGGGAGVVVCLECGANDLHMVQLMPLTPHHLLLQ